MIGKNISHYRIIEKLGEGGMGVVYKALDTKLDRFVALKFLPPHVSADKGEMKRFIHEAKAASKLDHTNICTVYEIDETESASGEPGGRMFIAMAYYEGETLKDKIYRKGESASPLPIDEAIDIAVQMARGLAKAHEKKIVHRDIKPANVLVTPEGVVKIVDFGLAKLAGRTKLTKTGTTLGTASYMSPEQARAESVDERSDIWSLGVILYEMVTGQLPFKGEYENAVIYSVLNESHEAMTALRTGVPMALERIVNKCLEKKATDRYQHADELIVDLRKANRLSEQKKPAAPKAVGKKSFVLPVIIILAIIVAAGYLIKNEFLSTKQSPSEPSLESRWENSIAVLPFKNISPDPDQEYFCDGMTEQIINNLSQIRQLKVISRTSVMKFKDSEQLVPEIASILNVGHILEGSVRKSRNRIRVTAQLINAEDDFHIWSKDFEGMLVDVFDLQDEISEKIVEALVSKFPEGGIRSIESRKTSNVEAYEYFLKGKYYHENRYIITGDDESFKLSEMMFKRAIQLDSSYALPHTALADLYHSYHILGSNPSVKNELFRLLKTYLDKAFRLDSTLSYTYLVKGRIDVIENDIEGEFRNFRKALQLYSNLGWNNEGFGLFLFRRGLYLQAVPYMSRAIELDPMVPSFYWARGFAYHYMGRFEEAENDYRKALELEANHVDVIERYVDFLIDMNRLDEAEARLNHLESLRPNRFLRAKFFAAKGEREKALDLMGSDANLQVFSLLGMRDEAVSLLENTLDRDRRLGQSYYWLYETNPSYENVRGDPRFREYLKEHKKIYEENLRKYAEM